MLHKADLGPCILVPTGFAAYWLRDSERSTAFPTPIDKMTKASALAQKSHASIPGIWLQETDTGFTVTVKPGFMPPGMDSCTVTQPRTLQLFSAHEQCSAASICSAAQHAPPSQLNGTSITP